MVGQHVREMKTATRIITSALVAAALATSCSGNGDKGTESDADIEAAVISGRNAAKSFATKEWSDTLQLQRLLLEVRSESSKYVMKKQMKCAEAFDSAFVSTMKTVRPELGRVLEASPRPSTQGE